MQQALFDLMWTQRIDTPVSDPSQFVIGVFGPIYEEYERRGSETGPLGFPIFDQLIDEIPTRFFQNFEHGQIRMEDGDILVLGDTPDTGATMIGEDEASF